LGVGGDWKILGNKVHIAGFMSPSAQITNIPQGGNSNRVCFDNAPPKRRFDKGRVSLRRSDGTHSVPTATARVSRCALPFLNRDDPRRTGGQRPGWHAPIGWEKRPSVIQEIAVAQERLHDIAMAIPRGCQKIWTLGNHDARFETRLATVAQGIKSYRLTPLFDSGVNCYGC
jgi:hypothetical protein